jgi:hypothetical protein
MTHADPNDLQPLPEKRTRLRSQLSLDNINKGEACDDCRKHKRKVRYHLCHRSANHLCLSVD